MTSISHPFAIAFALTVFPMQALAAQQNALDDVYSKAGIAFYKCALQFQIADTVAGGYGVNSPKAKKAFDEAADCREKELARSRETIDRLKLEIGDKPNAVNALKDFATYWRTALETLSSTSKHKELTLDGLRARIERVRTENDW